LEVFFEEMLLLFLFVAFCLSEKCTPTPATDMGPAYFPGPPFRKDNSICEGPSRDLSVLQSSKNHPFLVRESVSIPSRTLVVRGSVRSSASCKALSGAEIDVWQADAEGNYGLMSSRDNYCRGVVKADSDGKFNFKTQFPASYVRIVCLFFLKLNV
jgi:protocatechuate 3,4-dioxygenase beta subunit